MAVLPFGEQTPSLSSIARRSGVVMGEKRQHKFVVSVVLWVILLFQFVNLLEGVLSHSNVDIFTTLLGVGICCLALLFNSLNLLTIASILLIIVVDLGCGLMLLTTPMGLDVMDLPVFDVLIVSELIAVSLLPARSVFIVMGCNILFIGADLLLQPHTMNMQMMFQSSMAYNAVLQPILLQIIVAVITYVWVRSAILAIARADRAEEIAELRRREMERTRELDMGVEHLSQILVQVANGDHTMRADLNQSNVLWRVGNAINLLLTRVRKSIQAEQENKRLRGEIVRLNMLLLEERRVQQQKGWQANRQTQQNRNPQY
jgi:hypothetical protein